MDPPLSQNAVGVCNQITLLIVYYIIFRLGTLLKVMVHLYESPTFLIFPVSFMFINFSFHIFLVLVSEMFTSFTCYIV